ncbi:MAG: chemotaxis response regulator protein-glutamate methylesterase [Gammaproteobacteria bacterium]|nr:chemotaxis response regulator protein-glutamate methylesterase [Gammaproteobacteria bacterium]
MRIAIVNDMKMAVESLRRVLNFSGKYEVAWVAYDGAEAVERCQKNCPDLILMDLIMPVMDGVQATRKIMQYSPCPILVVTSSVHHHSAQVFEAMGAGALDAVNTPELGLNGDGQGRDDLLKKIATLQVLINAKDTLQANPARVVTEKFDGSRVNNLSPLIVIGASSGGPQALLEILSDLPENYNASILVVQHVDAQFAGDLARWLDSQCKVHVRLAKCGDIPMSGTVLIAGTGDHMIMTAAGKLSYRAEPVDEVYRPSVDILFNSVVKNWRSELVGVLLTGMGQDGAKGLLNLRKRGCYTIAQNRESSAVYGMPKAAIEAGAAVDVLPVEMISSALMKRSNGG